LDPAGRWVGFCWGFVFITYSEKPLAALQHGKLTVATAVAVAV
jgi:hypothetical protein